MFVSSAAHADGAAYTFKPTSRLFYEVSVRSELPTETKTTIGYVILTPKSVDAAGASTLNYSWIVRVFRTQTANDTSNVSYGSHAALGSNPPAESGGPDIVIDKLGVIVRSDVPDNDAQLESTQGPAWRVPLPPLPPAGQQTWTTTRQLMVYHDERPQTQQPPMGFFNREPSVRVESPADERVTYTVGPMQNGLLTVQRHYELTSAQKVGNAPADHLTGDGQYVFNTAAGVLESLEYKYVDELTQKNVSVKVPVTLSAHRVDGDELAKLHADVDASEARNVQAAASSRNETSDLPDGMVKTDMLGATEGGGPFINVSPDHKPLIGFRLKTDQWMDRKAFRVFEPLFDKPEGPAEKGVTQIVARDGYAVGAITVNATDFLNAVCITFMKKTDAGLDPKTSYNSPWYGQPRSAARKKLSGKDGQVVYGIFGRKGLNVDAVGLLTDAPPGDVTEK